MSKILILTDAHNYANNRIKEEGVKRGHKVLFASPDDFMINYGRNGEVKIYVSNLTLVQQKFEAIIPRLGTNRAYGTFVLKNLIEHGNLFSTADPEGLNIASNKLQSAFYLNKAGVKQPTTTAVKEATNFSFMVDSVGGLPCVMKMHFGSKGNGIFILNNALQSSVTLKNFATAKWDFLLQEMIETANDGEAKSDIRAWIVDYQVVAAFKRFSNTDDFRSNFSISKSGETVKLTDKEKELAIKAAKALKLPCCGVDIARDVNNDNEPIIYEVNGCADLKGIEAVTGLNVAGDIIKFVEKGIKERQKSFKESDIEPLAKGAAQLNNRNYSGCSLMI